MLFCGLELAARIERAECQLLEDACAQVAQRCDGILATRFCGGFAAFTEPGSPLNKIAGLGLSAAFDEQEFARVEREYTARKSPMQVELATLADPAIAKFLCARGFELVGVENVLGLELPCVPPSDSPATLEIAHSPAAEIDAWLDVVVTGFATPDTQGIAAHQEYDRAVLERVVRDFASARGVVRYLALREGRAVRGASMRLFEGVAQLCGAATLPEQRGRGVQSLLLSRRLAEAGRAGCSVATVTTQPGSKSQQNVQRQGFTLLYSRNVLLREAR
jgi:GNAT superfamily N-acetyltransferase